jgi:hypothetical protein
MPAACTCLYVGGRLHMSSLDCRECMSTKSLKRCHVVLIISVHNTLQVKKISKSTGDLVVGTIRQATVHHASSQPRLCERLSSPTWRRSAAIMSMIPAIW